MAKKWAGWGAGPSGAGAVGGPSRIFLGLACAACVAVAVILYHDRKLTEAGVAGAAAVYFAARYVGLVGRRRE